MFAAVEILAGEEVGNPIPGVVVEQHSTEDRLLGLHRVWGNAKRRRLGLRVEVVEYRRIGHIRERAGWWLQPAPDGGRREVSG